MNESMGRRIAVAAIGSVIAGITIALFAPSVPGVRGWIGREAPAAWARATGTFRGEAGSAIAVTLIAVVCIVVAARKARGEWGVWRDRDVYQYSAGDSFRNAAIFAAIAVGMAAFLIWVYFV